MIALTESAAFNYGSDFAPRSSQIEPLLRRPSTSRRIIDRRVSGGGDEGGPQLSLRPVVTIPSFSGIDFSVDQPHRFAEIEPSLRQPHHFSLCTRTGEGGSAVTGDKGWRAASSYFAVNAA